MNIGKAITSAFNALKFGNEFVNVERAKRVQVMGSLVIALVGLGAAFGFDLAVTDEQIMGFSGVLVAILNIFMTVGSTKKIGMQKQKILTEQKKDDEGDHPFNVT